MSLLLILACTGDDLATPATPGATAVGEATPATAGEAAANDEGGGLLGGLLGGGLDCDDDSLASQPLTRSCLTGTIECGQTLKGHTRGGASVWDGDFYRSKFCAPTDDETYEGTERVYFLAAPAEVEVRVSLTSPCEDLDLFLVSWSDPNSCPTIKHSVGVCEADTTSGGGKVKTQNINRAYSYMVGVEGARGRDAPFEISVECAPLNPR